MAELVAVLRRRGLITALKRIGAVPVYFFLNYDLLELMSLKN